MLTSAPSAVSPASHHPQLHRVCMQTRPRHLVHPHAFINGLTRIFQGNDVAFSAKNTRTIGGITDVSPMGVGMNSISHPLDQSSLNLNSFHTIDWNLSSTCAYCPDADSLGSVANVISVCVTLLLVLTLQPTPSYTLKHDSGSISDTEHPHVTSIVKSPPSL
jgi:hypothetical protein